MQRAHYDAVVVGGGPAGAIAAYTLARQSLKVALLEKEALPRYKACGGAVALHTNKLLDFPIDAVVERQISRMLITVNLKSPFTSAAPQPIASMVMRDRFDSLLLDVAAGAGVTVHPRSPLVGLVSRGDGYMVDTPQRTFDTRYLIGADGANSTTRKLVGAPRFKRLAVALEWEIRSPAERVQRWVDRVAIDFGSLRSGYGWIFPKAQGFSVGVVAPKSLARQLRPYCERMVCHYADAIGDADPHIKAGHHLPMRVPGEPLVFGRTLLVGDAAGLIDPVVGEGIYYALRSGQLAAETIGAAARQGDERLADYERNIDRIIQPDLQVSKSLLRMLDWSPSFWIPRVLKESSSFWKYFCSIYAGEGSFADLPRKLRPFGGLLHSTFARDDLKLYGNRVD